MAKHAIGHDSTTTSASGKHCRPSKKSNDVPRTRVASTVAGKPATISIASTAADPLISIVDNPINEIDALFAVAKKKMVNKMENRSVEVQQLPPSPPSSDKKGKQASASSSSALQSSPSSKEPLKKQRRIHDDFDNDFADSRGARKKGSASVRCANDCRMYFLFMDDLGIHVHYALIFFSARGTLDGLRLLQSEELRIGKGGGIYEL